MAAPARVATVVDELGRSAKASFSSFLTNFYDQGVSVYTEAIAKLSKEERTTLGVDFQHVYNFSEALAQSIEAEYFRLDPFLRQALKEIVAQRHPDYATNDKDQEREFYISFTNLPSRLRIRELNTHKIGRLVSIQGTVVRTSAVHPELISGVFQCQDCRTIIGDVMQQFKFTEPTRCINPACESKNAFKLILESSQFVDFQKVRVQESSEEIPSGSMPRSIEIVLRHEQVERAKAGDKMLFTGTLIVIPDVSQLAHGRAQLQTRGQQRGREGYSQDGITGLKALGVRDLTYRMAFLACDVQPLSARSGQINIRDEDATIESVITEFTAAEREKIVRMKHDEQLYQKLTASVAPAIFGHEEVKRGLLLMLFGGVHKTTPDHINLRGDINVCIVGDPSTAKSQFLKYVAEIVPRAVYTSGKASSAAGLTAAVVKDEDSGEFFIEAGALMLADNGICCIDEFDKMDVRDQVAIHEAMEQQTITITKAGIQATLNARTSVLAAANPINGRYDKSKSLKSNIAMTAPIMSRFDLFFVILDECHEVSDYNIARHITNMHRLRDDAVAPEYTTAEVQRYIKFARTLRPELTRDAARELVTQYKRLRQGDSGGAKTSYRVTVRQLESMIRLSEALARLHCEDDILPAYVKEAARLIRSSILRVETDDLQLHQPAPTPSISTAAGAAPSTPASSQEDAPVVSYEKYRNIALRLIHRLRQHEETAGEGADIGLRKRDLINWYVGEMERETATESEALHEAKIVYLVISRLVNVDGVLLEVDGERVEEDRRVDIDTTMDKMIVVHPNFVPE